MMTTFPVHPVHATGPQHARTRSPWIARALWLALTLSLCATNLLTLLDHDFRSKAYDAVTRIAGSPASETMGFSSVAKILEERSPAALEKKAVERATVQLAASSALLRQEIGNLKRDREIHIAQRAFFERQLRESQAVIASHRSRISDLGKKVLARAGKSVVRHLAALPGHALPLLSATVAAGSVALDIRDACDSVKELDEINRSVGLAPADRTQVCGRTVPTPEELLAAARANWKGVYEKSADALNAGAQMIPRAPPPVSFDSARTWLSSTFGR